MPPSKCFVYVNPVQLHFDVESCLWFASFGLGLHESLLKTSVADSINSPTSSKSNERSLMYMDVKLEAIMPRVIIESTREVSMMQKDRPKTMQVQVSRFAVTNIREMGASRADLAQAVHSLQEGSLVFSTGFPSKPDDLSIVTDRILSHIAATDVSSNVNGANFTNSNNLSRYALWNDTRDVWCIKIDPVWIDFLGARSIGVNRSIPFIDAVPITLWIHGKSNIEEDLFEKVNEKENSESNSDQFVLSAASLMKNSNDFVQTKSIKSEIVDEKSANIHVIVHFGNLVSIQLDHYQLLFLMRFLEEVNELTTYLAMDTKRITTQIEQNQSVIIGCVIPQVEVTLVMPSQTPGKESSGCCDGESVLPDSASLYDEVHTQNSGWLQQGSVNPFSSIESPSPSKQEKFDFPPAEPKSNIKFNIPDDNDTTPSKTTNQHVSSSSSSSTSTLKNKSRTSGGDTMSNIIPKELNTGLNSMKKGFSRFMTSIDSALTTTASFDDGSDTISIQSDFSDDSDFFVVLGESGGDGNEFMFKLNPAPDQKLAPVEVASEVCEDPYLTNLSSPSEPSETSSLKRRDLVSMVTIRWVENFHEM